MGQRLFRALHQLQRFIDHVWFPPFLGFLCILDLFILIVPLDALLISSVLLRPSKWLPIFLCMTAGAVLGSFGVCWLVQCDPELLNRLFQNALHTETWRQTEHWVNQWGIWGLVGLGMSPVPQQFPVLIAGLAQMKPLEVAISLGVGRFMKYAIYGWAAAHAPQWLARIPFLRKEIERITAANRAAPPPVSPDLQQPR
jgi:membrane protein YqaA with SNARE-associated domain